MTQRDNPEIFKLYNSAKWEKVRKMKLGLNPFCERCQAKGLYNSAYIVHHKEYITEENYQDGDVFFNLDNLESLCIKCHNQEHFKDKDKKEYSFDENGDIIKK